MRLFNWFERPSRFNPCFRRPKTGLKPAEHQPHMRLGVSRSAASGRSPPAYQVLEQPAWQSAPCRRFTGMVDPLSRSQPTPAPPSSPPPPVPCFVVLVALVATPSKPDSLLSPASAPRRTLCRRLVHGWHVVHPRWLLTCPWHPCTSPLWVVALSFANTLSRMVGYLGRCRCVFVGDMWTSVELCLAVQVFKPTPLVHARMHNMPGEGHRSSRSPHLTAVTPQLAALVWGCSVRWPPAR